MWILDIENNHNSAKRIAEFWSLLAAFGTFIPYNDGRAKTGRAVDAGNFRLSRRVTKDKILSLNKLRNFRVGCQ